MSWQSVGCSVSIATNSFIPETLPPENILIIKEITKDHGLSGVEIKNVFDSTGNKRLKANKIS